MYYHYYKTVNTFQEEEAPKEVQTEFGVKLIKFDDAKKVKLIKEIKAVLTDINLVQVRFVSTFPNVLKYVR